MNEKIIFRLTLEEKNSPLWNKIKSHLTEKLEILRVANDGDKNEIETSKIRGKIAEIKALMSLDKDLINLE